jgi:hypothetical protein
MYSDEINIDANVGFVPKNPACPKPRTIYILNSMAVEIQ